MRGWWRRWWPFGERPGEVARVRAAARADRFDEAERDARRLLEQRTRRDGAESVPWAEASWLLLEVLLLAGKAADAEALELAGHLLRFEESRGGQHSAEVSETLRKLAFVAATARQPEQTLPHVVRALAILEEIHGPDDPRLIPVLTNLGLTQSRTGQPEAARVTLGRAVRLQRAGHKGEFYFPALYRLAQLCALEGDAGTAIPLLLEALEWGSATLGPDHLSIGAASFTLGQAYMLQDRAGEAQACFERTLRIESAALGDDHHEVAATLIELAGARGESDEGGAVRDLERALSILERRFGDEAVEIVPALGALARHRFGRGEIAACRQILQRLLAIEERAFGPGSERLIVTLGALAAVHEAGGNFVDARRLRERALAAGEALWGKQHHDLIPLLEGLASLFAQSGDWTRCRELNERLLALHRRELGATHPTVTGKLQVLAVIAARSGDFDESSRRFTEALEIVERAPAGQGAQLQAMVRHLAGLWEAQDREGPFGPLLQRARVQERKSGGGARMPEA